MIAFPQVENGDADTSENEKPEGDVAPMPWDEWKSPAFVLFCTGRQHGYLEPCGCTGLENAKGGLSRRHALLQSLRERDWPVVAVDVGNQVRRLGPQAELKLQTTNNVLRSMEYAAIGIGPDDLRLSIGELASVFSDETNYTCANANCIDLYPRYRIAEAGKRKIGIVAVLGTPMQKSVNNPDVQFSDPEEALRDVLPQLKTEGIDKIVLLAHTTTEDTKQLAKAFPDIDVIVTAGGAGEPTLEPETVDGSRAQVIQVGTKGMYVGVLGFFPESDNPLRYERVELDARFPDSKIVLDNFGLYQSQLQSLGLSGLGVKPAAHPSGDTFVGSETCGDCHTTAYEIFEKTPHFHATDSISNPTQRSDIPRHHDPECLSCHVTGWNAQGYFPYESGYVSLAGSEHLHGNGCENCHGPGSRHVAAESGDMDATDEQLQAYRDAMKLTIEKARESKCYECHDPDNSPEFDFDGTETGRSYWDEVKHVGKD